MGRFFALVGEQLDLWVRQLAWLNTAPDIEHRGPGPKPLPVSRIAAMRERGEPILWPLNPAPHVTDWLLDIGPAAAGPMGDVPLPWTEITEWQRNVGIELDAWEARTIRALSRAFVSQRHAAERPNCPPPYSGIDDAVHVVRDKVTDQFAAMLKAVESRG